MNNTDLTKRHLEVNLCVHEQHGPNQKTTGGEPMCSWTTRTKPKDNWGWTHVFMNNTDLTKRQHGVNPGVHEQHGPNQKTAGGEPMCSWTTRTKPKDNWGWTYVFMNNTDLTKRQLGVNPCVHEQHGPNQKTTGGEPMCSWTTRTKPKDNWGWTYVFMNNTDLTKRQQGVNPCVQEQHGPNQKTAGGEPMCSWTTRTQPKDNWGEPMCSWTTRTKPKDNWGWTYVFMNNTDPTKRQLGVNSGAHEQHGPNQKTTGGEIMYSWTTRTPSKRQLKVNSGAHEQHGPNQMKTASEPRCSWTTRT